MELFKLFGTIAVNNDGAIQAIDETSDAAEQSESKMSNAFDKIGSAAVKVGKVVVAGLAAGATAIGALTKSAIAAYGDYEQLVGGVETLFKNSANKVMEYANNAYKTAGLSANEYMETVTSFSASLLQGLGGDTAEAAEIAHIAITDMSDNANKMGTDITAIQNAYQGFAKQNYTMLDNLKLGYGGTQTEMIRLINDSGILNETISDLDNVTFDQMIQAIHVVQENMGITGTTALEASTTIQGSVASMKSAWSNMLVGLADDTQNFNVLLGNFVDSAVTVVGNILPRIQIIFDSIPQLINGLVPQIPGMLQSILPGLIQGATALMNGLVAMLPEIIQILIASLPLFIEGFVQIFIGLVENLGTIVAPLVEAIPEVVVAIVDGLVNGLGDADSAFSGLAQTAVYATGVFIAFKAAMAIQSVIQGFQKAKVALSMLSLEIGGANLAQAALNGTLTVGETIVGLLTGKIKLAAVAQGLMTKAQGALNAVLSANPIAIVITAIAALVAAFIYLWNNCESFRNFWIGLWNGIKETAKAVADWIKQAWTDIGNFFTGTVPGWFNSFKDFFVNLWNAIVDFLTNILNTIKDGITTAFNAIKDVVTTVFNAVKDFITNVWNSIKNTITNVVNAIKNTVSNVFNSVKSTVINIFDSMKSKVTSIWNGVKTAIQTSIDGAKNIVKTGLNAIKGFFDSLKIKFPDIKLPHFKISGSFSLSPPSVPKLSIDWYAKAMDNAMLLNSPTIFGMNGAGQLMGGGEAGQEVVAGSDTLMSMIRGAVQTETSGVADRLERLISMLAEYLPEITLNANRQIVLDTGVLAGQLAPTMDSKLGDISRLRGRGR